MLFVGFKTAVVKHIWGWTWSLVICVYMCRSVELNTAAIWCQLCKLPGYIISTSAGDILEGAELCSEIFLESNLTSSVTGTTIPDNIMTQVSDNVTIWHEQHRVVSTE